MAGTYQTGEGMTDVNNCTFFFPGADVLAMSGERRGQWGTILCIDPSPGGLALVCWDVWTPPSRGALGYVPESLSIGACDFDAADPSQCARAIAAGVPGTSAAELNDLLPPSGGGFCNGSVCVRCVPLPAPSPPRWPPPPGRH